MQLDTLQKIEKRLNDYQLLEDKKIKEVLLGISIYKNNEYIYPDYIIEKTSLNERECFRFFSYLNSFSIVETMYKIVCPVCRELSEKIYRINEIEATIECEGCNTILKIEENPFRYLMFIYKVVGE